MNRRITDENNCGYTLCPLAKEEVGTACALCDLCVGKNLYSEEEIRCAAEAEDRFFYLLRTDAGECVGYLYFYLTDKESVAGAAKLDRAVLDSVYRKSGKRVGKIQSVGLRENCRGRGLAKQLLLFATEQLAHTVEAVFVVCWKPGGVIPLGKALGECGFCDLAEAERVWYDDPSLICPYCHGRCVCRAEIFYKLLNGKTGDLS